MHSPRISLQAVEHILRYLKTTPGQGMVYKTSSSFSPTLVAYSDVDYAGSLDDRRSTSGFCTYFGGHLVNWRSKKQSVVARSLAEVEYRSMTSIVFELTWLESLLGDLRAKLFSPATLLCDSQTAIHIAKNLVFHERTKHIEVDCHFIREKFQMKKLEWKHVPVIDQVVDLFAKALSRVLFHKFLSKLGAYDLYAPACGGVLEENHVKTHIRVQNDIVHSLKMSDPYISIGSFDRENLFYGVKLCHRSQSFLDELVKEVSKYNVSGDSVIIYCTTVKDTEQSRTKSQLVHPVPRPTSSSTNSLASCYHLSPKPSIARPPRPPVTETPSHETPHLSRLLAETVSRKLPKELLPLAHSPSPLSMY
ncbi:hypothetical protein KSP39_PZI008817 [Platanthera zijinensis]|uniref:Retrovirus-related Pol polyprotein from transposon RE2 n=1 Tax=Platanthera zijinensis TaxID=2320716 RepID=A0AAP0BL68_9ASPA